MNGEESCKRYVMEKKGVGGVNGAECVCKIIYFSASVSVFAPQIFILFIFVFHFL